MSTPLINLRLNYDDRLISTNIHFPLIGKGHRKKNRYLDECSITIHTNEIKQCATDKLYYKLEPTSFKKKLEPTLSFIYKHCLGTNNRH